MTARSIEIRPAARKSLLALHPDDRRRIGAALERFAYSAQGDVERLAGSNPPNYRLRVGKLRIILALSPTTLTVTNIDNRGEVYKRRR